MKKAFFKTLRAFFGIKIRLWSAILVCVIVAGLVGGMTTVKSRRQVGGADDFAGASKYVEVKNVIDEYYVGAYDESVIANASYTAMLKALGDQWSYYMTPADYQAYQLYAANQYEGIGVSIALDSSGGFTIVSVNAGTPAETAGLKSGDIIMAIEGNSVVGMTTNDASSIIQSQMGETLTMTVKIKSTGKTEDVAVDCTSIYINPVSYEMQERRIGYVKLNNFEAGAADGAKAAVEALLTEGATAIVFDVRNNPGGLLTELTSLLDYLLPEGDIFVSLDQNGEETVTTSDNVCLDMPMAVLINAGTYSAAEYFAAALDEYDWATTLGEATTGKGRSQTTVELSDGSAVHISNNSYLTPNRVDLSVSGGLIPDQSVVQKDKGDIQLDAAISAMIAAVKSGA